ncbi:Oligosaccaryltransferase-domain-containing protein [Thelonectria olida]|uniref:Dolichyl-diphosphooligosaccharide--protein glycosyltransferase subunit 4 n=1 Tax=Thelonectria olida TaxID=1576542 RepID=A0A9P8WG67_9HYPO|nr:Oligosaccaryltransferase-domain-containing protein [Thelonectria olida]
MISDADLYRLAVFLGSTSMVLIVLYHFLEINADGASNKVEAAKGAPIKKQAAN